MQILSPDQAKLTIRRLALELLVTYHKEDVIYVGGINNNGKAFGLLLKDELERISKKQIHFFQIQVNPANPTGNNIVFDCDIEQLSGSSLLIVDDVANTGRTLFYAFKPLYEVLPKSLRCAVLVDRKHKAFPVHVDFVGISLATTFRNNIDVHFNATEIEAVLT